MTYDRILVATDGSEPAQAAATEAVTLAEAFDATLYALYVLDAAEPPPWYDDPAIEPGIDTRAGLAFDAVVSEATMRNLANDVVTAAVEGQTAQAIVAYAEEHDIDCIVMGTHGRTGLDRFVVGSVAERVVRESPVPVMTVHSE